MRNSMLCAGLTVLGIVACGDATQKQPIAPQRADTPPARDAAPESADTSEEQAVRQTAAAFVKAYNAGDAKAIAAQFTPNAEFQDEQGNLFRGREEIEAEYVAFFKEYPKAHIEIAVDDLRFISPGVAVEKGSVAVVTAPGDAVTYSRYIAVQVKRELARRIAGEMG